MADIAKCEGTGCPFKYACRRFTAGSAPHAQWWLSGVPYNPVDHVCVSFLGNGRGGGPAGEEPLAPQGVDR